MTMSFIAASIAAMLLCTGCRSSQPQAAGQLQQRTVNDGCDGCELIYEGMPERLSWIDTLPDWHQSRKLVVSGRVLKPDGNIPAADVIIYFYHTDSTGHYTPAPQQTSGKRHGFIRGWVKTNGHGEYRIYTNRPAPYPDANIPAHIHLIVKEPDANEYYVDEYEFDDDPLLTDNLRSKRAGRGGSGVCKVTASTNGWQECRRDIILGKNIPGYPQ